MMIMIMMMITKMIIDYNIIVVIRFLTSSPTMLNYNIPFFSIISIQILTSHLIISIFLVPVLPLIISIKRKSMMLMVMMMVVVVVLAMYSTILLLLVVVLLQRYRALKRVP